MFGIQLCGKQYSTISFKILCGTLCVHFLLFILFRSLCKNLAKKIFLLHKTPLTYLYIYISRSANAKKPLNFPTNTFLNIRKPPLWFCFVSARVKNSLKLSILNIYLLYAKNCEFYSILQFCTVTSVVINNRLHKNEF